MWGFKIYCYNSVIVLVLHLELERPVPCEGYDNTVIHNFSYLQPVKAQVCACVFNACNALYANASCVYPAYVMAIWFAWPIQRHSKLQLCGFGTFEVGLYRSFATEYSFIHSFIPSEFVSISLLYVQIPAWLFASFPYLRSAWVLCDYLTHMPVLSKLLRCIAIPSSKEISREMWSQENVWKTQA